MIFLVNKMRTFYIFKINREFKIITRDKPYNLFLALNNIHNMPSGEIGIAIKLFDEICEPQDKTSINLSLFNQLRDSDDYTKFQNSHLINNYYTSENSKLIVNEAYLKINSSLNNPTFFKLLKTIPNLFVIDFYSKDYFWLS